MTYWMYTPTAALLALAHATMPAEGLLDALQPLAFAGLTTWSAVTNMSAVLRVGSTFLYAVSTLPAGGVLVLPLWARVPVPLAIAVAAGVLQPAAWPVPVVLAGAVAARLALDAWPGGAQ